MRENISVKQCFYHFKISSIISVTKPLIFDKLQNAEKNAEENAPFQNDISRNSPIPVRLSAGGKNAVLSGETLEGVVALTHPANLATDGVRLVVARHAASLLIHHRDVDLHRCMITGSDNPVGCGAFSGDVKVDVFSGFVLHLDIFVVIF